MPGGKHGGKAVIDDDYDDYDDYEDDYYDEDEEVAVEEHVTEPAKAESNKQPLTSTEDDAELHSLLCQLIPGLQDANNPPTTQVSSCMPSLVPMKSEGGSLTRCKHLMDLFGLQASIRLHYRRS